MYRSSRPALALRFCILQRTFCAADLIFRMYILAYLVLSNVMVAQELRTKKLEPKKLHRTCPMQISAYRCINTSICVHQCIYIYIYIFLMETEKPHYMSYGICLYFGRLETDHISLFLLEPVQPRASQPLNLGPRIIVLKRRHL